MKVVANRSFFESLKRLNSLKNKWHSFLGWFKYHFKKDNFNLMKVCWKGRPWDYGYLYDLEQAKIKEMVNYHERQKRFVGVEQVIRDMKLCINLIDIFSEKRQIFHFTGKLKFDVIDDDNCEIKRGNLEYHCDVNVNLKNIKRFVNKENLEFFEKYYKYYPHEFYILKARHLYHKIRLERDDTWWD